MDRSGYRHRNWSWSGHPGVLDGALFHRGFLGWRRHQWWYRCGNRCAGRLAEGFSGIDLSSERSIQRIPGCNDCPCTSIRSGQEGFGPVGELLRTGGVSGSAFRRAGQMGTQTLMFHLVQPWGDDTYRQATVVSTHATVAAAYAELDRIGEKLHLPIGHISSESQSKLRTS